LFFLENTALTLFTFLNYLNILFFGTIEEAGAHGLLQPKDFADRQTGGKKSEDTEWTGG